MTTIKYTVDTDGPMDQTREVCGIPVEPDNSDTIPTVDVEPKMLNQSGA
jgi:hypothetical protein